MQVVVQVSDVVVVAVIVIHRVLHVIHSGDDWGTLVQYWRWQ